MILYIGQLVFPTALLGFTLNTFQIGQVSLERVEELLQRVPLIRDQQPTSAPLTANPVTERLKGTLEARASGSGTRVPSRTPCTASTSASRKASRCGARWLRETTLAKAFGRMVPVEPGQLFLDGVDVTCLPLDTLRRSVAMVPQEGFLFTSTLADNLRYGDPEASDAQVRHSAEQARLADDVRGFPDGFQTVVGERGITLSGGQRQRTALGRALLVSSPVLVLDDALASVDNNTAAAVLESIRGQDDRTIVMISHQLSAAAACDRILVMEAGRIVQQGHHNDLIRTHGTYQRLWERQQAAERLDAMAS